MRKLIPPLFLLLLAISILGCGDDEASTNTGGLVGTVLHEPEGTAVAGAEVVLLRSHDLTVAAGPRLTDAAGEYGFAELQPGRYHVLAFSAPDLILDQSESAVVIEAERVTTHRVRLIASQLWEEKGVELVGTVIDAETEEPIPGAFASDSFGAEGLLRGLVDPGDAVTDAGGVFRMPNPSLQSDELGSLSGFGPFTVTKEGYRPALVDTLGAVLDEADTTYAVTIPLTRMGADEGVTVRGSVVDEAGGSVAGVRVRLSILPASPPSKARGKTPMLGYAATSDAVGAFAFGNVPPGFFRVEAGADLDDGWVLPDGVRTDFIVVDEAVDVGALVVYPAISILGPEPGSVVSGDTVTLTWEAVEGAAFYEVGIGSGGWMNETTVDAPSLTIGLLPAKAADGVGRWYVQAFDAEENFLAATDEIASFLVDLPDEEE